jgi:hypothetical protein
MSNSSGQLSQLFSTEGERTTVTSDKHTSQRGMSTDKKVCHDREQFAIKLKYMEQTQMSVKST